MAGGSTKIAASLETDEKQYPQCKGFKVALIQGAAFFFCPVSWWECFVSCCDLETKMSSPKFYSLRVWPNGEFGVGLVTKFTPPAPIEQGPSPKGVRWEWIRGEPTSIFDAIAFYGSLTAALAALCPGMYESTLEEISALGSSNASNSHRRPPRGLKGVTSLGRRMLRNGAYLLEKAVGRRRVAMLTTTIPTLPVEVYKRVTCEWAEIVRIFTQWITRQLRKAHGYSWLVGCVEIQEKRLASEGGLPLHLHLCFQSKTKREFTIDKDEISRVWQRAVCSRVPDAASVNWSSATRIETVKKSVENYISKYISKGVNQNVLVSVSEGFKMPSAWWICAGGLKQEIKRRTVYETGPTASSVWWLSHNRKSLFTYIFRIEIGSGDTATCVGISGKMCEPIRRLCVNRDVDSLQILLDS